MKRGAGYFVRCHFSPCTYQVSNCKPLSRIDTDLFSVEGTASLVVPAFWLIELLAIDSEVQHFFTVFPISTALAVDG